MKEHREKKSRGAYVMAALVALTALGGALGAANSAQGALGEGARMFAVNVGKGDALIVQAGDYACLVDAGKPWAMGRVKSALEALGIEALDAVFLTHPDDDHAGGLEWLAASDIPVGAWYASGMYAEVKPDKHPALKAALARGQDVQWLVRGDSVPLGDSGAVFRVLAPQTLMTDKDDNNSLVMMLETDAGRMLLTGDMELPQEALLMAQGDDLSCRVLKAPNHGDGDTLSAAFAFACAAEAAVISTDGYEKPGTPDPGVLERLAAAGTACYVTQDCELGFDVILSSDGALRVESVAFGEEIAQGVGLSAVIPGEDLITVTNAGADRDISGWYLYSLRGDELYAFPRGTRLSAGASVTVGSRSSKGDYDLLWDDKKVVHPSKEDTVILYDRYGRYVGEMSNGQ